MCLVNARGIIEDAPSVDSSSLGGRRGDRQTKTREALGRSRRFQLGYEGVSSYLHSRSTKSTQQPAQSKHRADQQVSVPLLYILVFS